jgi:O-antigen/teichoic acid export membrane protein
VFDAADNSPNGTGSEPSRRQILVGSTGAAIAIVAGQAAAGLSFLVLARRLTPNDFGIFAILYAAGVTLGALLDFGSSQLRVRELAKGLGLDSFSSWLWRRAAWQAPLVVAAIAAAHVSVESKASLLVTAALISQGLTMPVSSGWSGAVRALRSPALGAWAVALGNAVLLGASLITPDRFLVSFAAVGATSSWLVSAMLSWRITASRMGSVRLRWNGSPWRGCLSFGVFGLAVGLQGLQVVVVGVVAGSAQAGELAAVTRWVQPVYLIAAAFSVQTFPSMAAAKSDAAARRILRTMWNASAFGVMIAIAIAIAAPLLVETLLGPEYGNSVKLLQALAIVAIPVLVNQPLTTYLQARGAERPVAMAMSSVVFLSLVAIGLTGSMLGAMAVPIWSGCAQVVLLVLLLRLFASLSRSATYGD